MDWRFELPMAYIYDILFSKIDAETNGFSKSNTLNIWKDMETTSIKMSL